MTSQTEEKGMEELVAEAKELNVKSVHLFKDPVKLQAKIDEAKSTCESEPVRKKAPKLRVSGLSGTSRNAIIHDLEKKDPECKYMTQSSKLTKAEAEAKGIEIVKKDNGEIMYCGDDIVCRTDKESYYEWQNDQNTKQLKAMKSIDKDLSTEHGGKKIQSCTENPKAGKYSADE